MEIIELSDDEPSPQPQRRQGPSQKLESGEGGALRGGEASRVGIILDKDEPGVRITIGLCEDEDGDGDEGSSVIDLTGDDNATLVRKLQRQLNAGTSATVDLASLHAARQARRTKVKADPDAPTISVEEDDLLYEERRKLKTFLQSSAHRACLSRTRGPTQRHSPAAGCTSALSPRGRRCRANSCAWFSTAPPRQMSPPSAARRSRPQLAQRAGDGAGRILRRAGDHLAHLL